MRRITAILVLALVWPAAAATTNLSTLDQADVQAAVYAMGAGDTVVLPSGTNTWTASVTITNPMTITGDGAGSTRLTNGLAFSPSGGESVFNINLATDGRMEISGIHFQGDGGNSGSAITVLRGSIHDSQTVIHDCTFDQFKFAVFVYDAFGVLYSNFWHSSGATYIPVFVRYSGYVSDPASTYGLEPTPWAWDSLNALVIEDNVVTYTNIQWDAYISDTQYPVPLVIRYNQFNLAAAAGHVGPDGHDMHGDYFTHPNNLHIQIYGNEYRFSGASSATTICGIRGGVGNLVYSNTIFGLSAAFIGFRNPSDSLGTEVADSYAWENYDGGGASSVEIHPGSAVEGIVEGENYTWGSGPTNLSQITHPHPLRVTEENTNSPSITAEPQSRTNAVGTTAAFFVGVDGAAPRSYQWRTNGVDSAGLTTQTLQWPVVGGDPTQWDCVVTNAYGAATSQVATLTVLTNAPVYVTNSWSATNGTLTPPMAVTDDYVSTPISFSGLVEYGVWLDADGYYFLEAEINAPNPYADSLFVNFNANYQSNYFIFDAPSGTIGAGWTNVVVSCRGDGAEPIATNLWYLTNGANTLYVLGRESGTLLRSLTISAYATNEPPGEAPVFPYIAAQPYAVGLDQWSNTLYVGDSLLLARGGASPYTNWTWLFYNTNFTFVGNGFTSNSANGLLSTTSVSTDMQGPYSVQWGNDGLTTNSLAWYLYVTNPVAYTANVPTATNVAYRGATILIPVDVGGGAPPLSFQWYYSDGTAIDGATSQTLTFTPLTNSTVYCAVTDSSSRLTLSGLCPVGSWNSNLNAQVLRVVPQ